MKGAWPIEKHYELNKCLILVMTLLVVIKAFFITIQNSKRLYKILWIKYYEDNNCCTFFQHYIVYIL